MSSDHSVSRYLDGLKQGEELAAQEIWERFYQRLIELADRKLKSSPRKAMDEEDVVQRAFTDFFLQVRQGRFPRLDDRDDLWQILAMLVDRRAKDQIRKQQTQKAGGGRVRTESVFVAAGNSAGNNGICQIEDLLPSPELALEMTEMVREKLALLHNDEQRKIALYKMQGYTNQEIAFMLPRALRSVERKLNSIRQLWLHIRTDDESGFLAQ